MGLVTGGVGAPAEIVAALRDNLKFATSPWGYLLTSPPKSLIYVPFAYGPATSLVRTKQTGTGVAAWNSTVQALELSAGLGVGVAEVRTNAPGTYRSDSQDGLVWTLRVTGAPDPNVYHEFGIALDDDAQFASMLRIAYDGLYSVAKHPSFGELVFPFPTPPGFDPRVGWNTIYSLAAGEGSFQLRLFIGGVEVLSVNAPPAEPVIGELTNARLVARTVGLGASGGGSLQLRHLQYWNTLEPPGVVKTVTRPPIPISNTETAILGVQGADKVTGVAPGPLEVPCKQPCWPEIIRGSCEAGEGMVYRAYVIPAGAPDPFADTGSWVPIAGTTMLQNVTPTALALGGVPPIAGGQALEIDLREIFGPAGLGGLYKPPYIVPSGTNLLGNALVVTGQFLTAAAKNTTVFLSVRCQYPG